MRRRAEAMAAQASSPIQSPAGLTSMQDRGRTRWFSSMDDGRWRNPQRLRVFYAPCSRQVSGASII